MESSAARAQRPSVRALEPLGGSRAGRRSVLGHVLKVQLKRNQRSSRSERCFAGADALGRPDTCKQQYLCGLCPLEGGVVAKFRREYTADSEALAASRRSALQVALPMNFAANTPVRTPVRIPETILTPAISRHFVENFLTAQGRISNKTRVSTKHCTSAL